MDKLIQQHPSVAWLLLIAAIATAITVLWKFVVPIVVTVVRGVRKLFNFVDDVAGEAARPGVEARPGLMDRAGSMEKMLADHGRRLAAIEHELKPNSGSSLRDAVDRVESVVTDLPPG
ncbi:MAG: hypothetical protein M3443_11395 [Actinomycetota bacterium]|nr:hypothetical protein [Actinomycetota bacterium]